MSVLWFKPEEVINMGRVYVSKCRRFMIVHAEKEYALSYQKQSERVVVGEYPELKSAKSTAEQVSAVWD